MLIAISLILLVALIMLGTAVARLSYIAHISRAQLEELKHLRDGLSAIPNQTSGSTYVDTEAIEQRLDAVLDHLGTNLHTYLEKQRSTLEPRKREAAARVREYLAANPSNLLGATKLYRDATGLGLKECLETVKLVAAGLGPTDESRTV